MAGIAQQQRRSQRGIGLRLGGALCAFDLQQGQLHLKGKGLAFEFGQQGAQGVNVTGGFGAVQSGRGFGIAGFLRQIRLEPGNGGLGLVRRVRIAIARNDVAQGDNARIQVRGQQSIRKRACGGIFAQAGVTAADPVQGTLGVAGGLSAGETGDYVAQGHRLILGVKDQECRCERPIGRASRRCASLGGGHFFEAKLESSVDQGDLVATVVTVAGGTQSALIVECDNRQCPRIQHQRS